MKKSIYAGITAVAITMAITVASAFTACSSDDAPVQAGQSSDESLEKLLDLQSQVRTEFRKASAQVFAEIGYTPSRGESLMDYLSSLPEEDLKEINTTAKANCDEWLLSANESDMYDQLAETTSEDFAELCFQIFDNDHLSMVTERDILNYIDDLTIDEQNQLMTIYALYHEYVITIDIEGRQYKFLEGLPPAHIECYSQAFDRIITTVLGVSDSILEQVVNTGISVLFPHVNSLMQAWNLIVIATDMNICLNEAGW